MTQDKKPKIFYGYIIVLAAFCIEMATWGANYTFGIFFEPVLTEFGWTRAATSGAFSLCMFLFGLLSIVMGRINDRFGPRFLLTGCSFSLGLGFLLMSQISAMWQLYLFYGVMVGIGLGGVAVPLLSTVARWFVKRRGLMTGITLAGIGLGGIIMPPLARWLISDYGWRTSYIVIGIAVLVLAMSAAQFLRRDPNQMGLSPYGENEVQGRGLDVNARSLLLRDAFHTKQLWMFCMMFFCNLFCLGTITVHIVIHATGLGISVVNAANIVAIMVGVSAAGRIIVGGIGDRIGNKSAMIIAFILMAIALFWLQLAKETWMFYLFAAIFGFSFGGVIALASPIVAELFGLDSHGVIFGIVTFVGQIGNALGPLLAGMIFDATNSYQPAFLICASVSVIGLILTLFLKPISSEKLTDSV